MALFSKPKVALWPKADGLDIYFNQDENNHLSFEIDLWQFQNEDSLKNLADFFKKRKVADIHVLLDDKYVVTKTFIYDSVVNHLNPEDVVTLAKDSVDFPISPESVTFDLQSQDNRTLVRTSIFNQEKFHLLRDNLSKLGLNVLEYKTVSEAVINVFSQIDNGQYFFFYPSSTTEYLAVLAEKGEVYLTSTIKKTLPELKKLLNYAGAYFGNKEPLQYLPNENYRENEIVTRFQKPSDFPLPLLAFFAGGKIKPAPAIIKTETVNTPFTPPMEENNKKNLLPIIAVFLVTLIAASLIVWYVLNHNKSPEDGLNNPGGETQTEEISPVPTDTQIETPTPTQAEVDKNIKIQVLNGTEINGQAATIKGELVKLGFTSIATGNSSSPATANKISTKASVPASYFAANLTSFQGADTDQLATSSSYDVVILIGTNLSGTSTATATPTKTGTTSATPTVKH